MPSKLARALIKTVLTQLVYIAYRFEAHGVQHVPEHGAVLVLSNHVSFFDWLFIGVALDRTPRFVMHEAHWRSRGFRWFFDLFNVIAIAPKKESPARLASAMRAIDQALSDGELVVLFPEGTMTPDGELSPLRPGVERILAKRSATVVPVGLRGLWGSMFSRMNGEPMTKLPRRFRARVAVEVGPAIPPGEFSLARLEQDLFLLISA